MSYAFYRFECAIRSAAILGLIGAGGLGFQLALSFQSLNYREIWTLLYALILLSAAADAWSSAVRARRAVNGKARDRVLTGSLVATGLMVPAASQGTRMARSTRLITTMLTRTVLVVLRAIPPPVWALLFLFVLFPGILPGSLALAVYTIGVLGRLMAEATENLDRRPLNALRAHGAPELHVFCYGVIPAASPRFIAYGLYRWEVMVRETIVVGAGGLGLMLDHQLAAFDYSAAVTTLLALIVLTLAVDFISASIRRSIR